MAPIKGCGVGLLECYVFMRWISHNHGVLVTHFVPPTSSHDSSSRLRKVINGGVRNREMRYEPGLYSVLLTLVQIKPF